jgi:two-component system sensor histidine kinase PilS (NtrC family)
MTPPAAGERAEAAAEAGLDKKLLWLTLFRIVSVTVLLGGTVITSWRAGDDGVITSALYGLVIGTYLASLISAWWLRQERALVPLAYAQLVFDVATATAVVALTGQAESVFVFMYSLGIVNGSILLFRRGAMTALGLALVAYVGMEVLTTHRPAAVPWTLIFVHAGAFAATAVLAGYLSEQLRRSDERLAERESELATITALHESIVQSVTSGLLTIDAGGRVTFLNRAGEQMLGVSWRDLMGGRADSWLGAFHIDTARGETDVVRPDQTRLRLGYSTFPLLGRQGTSFGTAVIFQDLTQLRAMEERVARSERLADLGQLAAGLAHELRNPLASMMGSVELLRGVLPGSEDHRLLDIVLREGGRLEHLVTEFLAFARPAPPRRERFDLAVVVAEALEAFHHDPAADGVELGRELEPAPATGDPDQVRQVLWNLLLNAAQALPALAEPGRARGTVRVACRPLADGGSELVVEDDGSGIALADQALLFTPFFTTKPEGTGLGLATVHRIVDAHGGSLSVDSTPGEGARFTVRLPPAASQPG